MESCLRMTQSYLIFFTFFSYNYGLGHFFAVSRNQTVAAIQDKSTLSHR